MTKTEVLDLLKENRDARGEANWKEMGDRTGGLTSFGIGLTKLRAIAKQVGCDHDLALKLWNERNHDAKIIGLLIDDPKQLTRDQVEKQVDGAGPGMLSHVLSSCDATLPKSPIAFEIAKGWMASKDPVRRSCGRAGKVVAAVALGAAAGAAMGGIKGAIKAGGKATGLAPNDEARDDDMSGQDKQRSLTAPRRPRAANGR